VEPRVKVIAVGGTAEEPGTRRERNPRGQGDRLRADVIAAMVRIVSDEERMRPVSVSLRELAREAGVTAPALYRHFSGTLEVARAVVLDGFERLLAEMEAADREAGDSSAAGRLAAQARAYCRFAVRDRGHFRLMFQAEPAMLGIGDESREPLAELVQRWRTATARLREDGLSFADTEHAAMYIWSALHGRLALTPVISTVWAGEDVERFVDLLVGEITTAARHAGPAKH